MRHESRQTDSLKPRAWFNIQTIKNYAKELRDLFTILYNECVNPSDRILLAAQITLKSCRALPHLVFSSSCTDERLIENKIIIQQLLQICYFQFKLKMMNKRIVVVAVVLIRSTVDAVVVLIRNSILFSLLELIYKN
uniref:Uncharacterized protein n=1 Tax=Glossina pallidipes TaxID=7398 RepID=A0A1B0AAQ5_GLOPL